MSKPSYEELERRFQAYCKHDGGRTYTGKEDISICCICGFDTKICQHRGQQGKFCSECAEPLSKCFSSAQVVS